jgi:hypothetical protein
MISSYRSIFACTSRRFVPALIRQKLSEEGRDNKLVSNVCNQQRPIKTIYLHESIGETLIVISCDAYFDRLSDDVSIIDYIEEMTQNALKP